jgi:RNA polymerase sigma factor (sigma-70 family)
LNRATRDADTDIVLVQRIRDRDLEAFAALYDRHAAHVYGLARRVLGHSTGAEDVVQDVFAALWEHPERYDPQRGPFLRWLLAVTHHKAVDSVRRAVVRAVAPLETVQDQLAAAEDVADIAVARAEADRVNQACAALPTEQREALMLTYWRGYTQPQAAALTGVPVGTVKWRVHAAIKRLRAELRNLDERRPRGDG